MANELNSSINETKKIITGIEQQLIDVNKQVLSILESQSLVNKEFSKFKTPKQAKSGIEKITKDSEKLITIQEKQRLSEIKLQKAREKAFDDYDKKINKEKKARERALKVAEKEALAIKKASDLNKKLGQVLNVAIRKRNELAASIQNLNVKRGLGVKLSNSEQKELKQSTLQFNKYDKAIRKAKESVGRFQENVGNYPKSLMAASKAARSLASSMGFLGGTFLIGSTILDAFTRVRQFDKSMQNLSGILRVSRKDVKDLEGEVIKVAGSSVRTSNEIADLAQTLVTLGKSKEDVKKLLSPVTDLSLGLGVAADESGEFLVQMLNAFGKGTDSAGEFADTIATIRTSTSLDFQKMRDSFQYIAPISRILNKDLAYTGALVGILADNGIKAQAAGRLLGSSIQRLASEGKTLEEALLEINKAQEQGVRGVQLSAMATKIFGVESAKVGIILANNSSLIEKNSQKIRDNAGALDDLVKEQLKSVDAKLKILESTWEELILTIDNGNGSISRGFKGFIELLTISIKKTTDLEKASQKLFELDIESSGWRSFFNTILPGLSVLPDSYKKAEEAQLRFNKTNESLERTHIDVVRAYKEKLVIAFNSKELSEKESKAYLGQIRVLEQSIKKKKIERLELVKTAKELEYSGQAYSSTGALIGKFYENAEQASSRELKAFIAANEKKQDILNKPITPEREKEGKREFKQVDTTEERIKKEIKAAEEILKTVKDSVKKDASFDLPEINQESLKDFSKKIKEQVSKELRVEIAKEDVAESFKQMTKGLEDLAGIESGVLDTFFDKISEKGEKTFEDIADIAQSSFNIIGSAGNSLFESRIEGYESDIDANNEYYSNLLDNEKLSDEEKKRLEDDRDAKDKEIKKKQKKEEEKAFLFNQALALAEIGINLAKTISAINLGAQAVGAATLGVGIAPYLGSNLPLAIGSATAQTALVLSKTIPKFAEGGTMKEDGLMQINDHSSGRLEVVKRDGKLLMTSKKNAIVEGKKGDEIVKDASKYFEGISDDELIKNIHLHSMLSTISTQNNIASRLENNKLINSSKLDTDRIVSAIKGQKNKINITNVTRIPSNGYIRALKEDF